MNKVMPSAKDIKRQLDAMPSDRLRQIAEAAGVPFTTLWKIKTGETVNPGIETVRRFYLLLDDVSEQKQPDPSAARSSSAINSEANA